VTKEISLKWLRILLAINIVSTIIHYTDNYIFFDRYPQPDWFSPAGVYIAWLVLVPFAFFGYWLYRENKFWLAYFCLLLYATTATSSLGHYFYASPFDCDLKMNLFICSDGLAGIALLAFIFTSFFRQEWRRVII
jgi:hypothetical protein